MSARRPDRRARLARGRRGLTLVEVLVALVILAGVLVGLAAYMTRFARQLTRTSVEATAADLVVNRLEFVKGIGSYAAVDGVAGTEAAVVGNPTFRRITAVQSVRTTTLDYKVVTVRVVHPLLGADTVRKTTVITRF